MHKAQNILALLLAAAFAAAPAAHAGHSSKHNPPALKVGQDKSAGGLLEIARTTNAGGGNGAELVFDSSGETQIDADPGNSGVGKHNRAVECLLPDQPDVCFVNTF